MKRILICLPLLLINPPAAAASDGAAAVLDWNEFGTSLLVLAPTALVDGRIYAMQHGAVHDALNTIKRQYERYSTCNGVPYAPHASPAAAVAQASYEVLTALWSTNPLLPDDAKPGFVAMIAERHATAMAAIPDGPGKASGVHVGRECAMANLDRRANDGIDMAGPPFSAAPAYSPGSEPGDYQFTPPFDVPPQGPFAFAPGWGNVAPFVIDVDRHRAPGPDALRSFAYALDVNYLRAIGRQQSSLRTANQTEIAQFWYELSPSGWNRLANTALRKKHASDWKAARVLALVNFAMADGYIALFRAKYAEPFWRPITAIREAATDGNPFTRPEAGWTPLCETPPIPEYPSNHTALGAAAATILGGLLGDRLSFSTTSASLPGVTREYKSFTQAAVENGLSRVYCGIHFVRAVNDGYRMGQSIGRSVMRELRPVR